METNKIENIKQQTKSTKSKVGSLKRLTKLTNCQLHINQKKKRTLKFSKSGMTDKTLLLTLKKMKKMTREQ